MKAAAATLFTLARPVAPAPIDLRLHRNPGDGFERVQLQWTGGLPPYDLHRLGQPAGLRDDTNILAPELVVLATEDSAATSVLYYYSVEEYP